LCFFIKIFPFSFYFCIYFYIGDNHQATISPINEQRILSNKNDTIDLINNHNIFNHNNLDNSVLSLSSSNNNLFYSIDDKGDIMRNKLVDSMNLSLIPGCIVWITTLGGVNDNHRRFLCTVIEVSYTPVDTKEMIMKSNNFNSNIVGVDHDGNDSVFTSQESKKVLMLPSIDEEKMITVYDGV
jgi:hypothetical protein